MREPVTTLEDVKTKILALKGKGVEMEINHGRKKISHYTGVIEDAYHSVFVVKIDNATTNEKISCSYSDILCGDVKIAVKNWFLLYFGCFFSIIKRKIFLEGIKKWLLNHS